MYDIYLQYNISMHPSMHPSIFIRSSGVGSRNRPSRLTQTPLSPATFSAHSGGLEAFPGQMGDIIILLVGRAQNTSSGRRPGGVLMRGPTTSADVFRHEGVAARLQAPCWCPSCLPPLRLSLATRRRKLILAAWIYDLVLLDPGVHEFEFSWKCHF